MSGWSSGKFLTDSKLYSSKKQSGGFQIPGGHMVHHPAGDSSVTNGRFKATWSQSTLTFVTQESLKSFQEGAQEENM